MAYVLNVQGVDGEAARHLLIVALKSHRVYVGDYLARLKGRPGPVSDADAVLLDQLLEAIEGEYLETPDDAPPPDNGDDLV